MARSRQLHAAIARAAMALFSTAGAAVAAPHGAFYLYPDFAPYRRALLRRFGVETASDLAELLLHRYGIGVLPGSAFGDPDDALRLRVATSRLYGEAEWQQEAALAADDPAALPWIAEALAWLEQALAEITAGLCRRSDGARPAHAAAAAALVAARISITTAAPLVSQATGMSFSSRQPTTMAAPAAVHSASVAPMPTASGSW